MIKTSKIKDETLALQTDFLCFITGGLEAKPLSDLTIIIMKTYIHRVKYYETDRMGVTHHSNYIRFMEEARVEFLREIGWDYAKLEEMGVISPVTEVECSYKKPTTFDDLIRITVAVEEFTGVRLRIRYRMEKEDGTLAVLGHSGHCFLNEKGLPIRLRRDFPEFYDALMRQLEGDLEESEKEAGAVSGARKGKD